MSELKKGEVLQYLGKGGEFDPEAYPPTHILNPSHACPSIQRDDMLNGASEGMVYFRSIDLRPRLQSEEPASSLNADTVLVWRESGRWVCGAPGCFADDRYWFPQLPSPENLLLTPPKAKPEPRSNTTIDSQELERLRKVEAAAQKLISTPNTTGALFNRMSTLKLALEGGSE